MIGTEGKVDTPSAGCRLEPLGFQHTDLIVRWRNDPDNARWFLGDHPFTRDGHDEWLGKQLSAGRDRNWIICASEGMPVGTVSIYNIDGIESAEFGRLLVAEASARGRGYGRVATELAVDYAMRRRIRRLYLSVREQNERAIAIYLQVGFRQVGQSDGMVAMQMELAQVR